MDTKDLKLGVYGGLAGGAVFGAMMGMMGMLPMIGSMVGSPTVFAGAAVHLVNSALIGAGFALLFGKAVRGIAGGVGAGVVYGVGWWFLGPLTLMPLFMGMGLGVNWNAGAAASMLPSLMGHVVYGAVLGAAFAALRQRNVTAATAPTS
jgi:hypothetical protein